MLKAVNGSNVETVGVKPPSGGWQPRVAVTVEEEDGNNNVSCGIGCSKGAAAIGGGRGSDVHGYCGGGQQWYGVRDGYSGSFLPQGSLLAVIKENDSKRSLLAVLGSERCMLRLKG
ncbi:hypothetical protein BHM03_00016853 [Ensete ventricosum]|nr:hypothetical protein BHM03_00016853 [Ensete ventricosum]